MHEIHNNEHTKIVFGSYATMSIPKLYLVAMLHSGVASLMTLPGPNLGQS